MDTVNLNEFIANLTSEGGMAYEVKQGDVAAIALAMTRGECLTSAGNVIQYHPERVADVLEATKMLSAEMRLRNQQILSAICRRLKGTPHMIYERWMAVDASQRCLAEARLALQEIECASGQAIAT